MITIDLLGPTRVVTVSGTVLSPTDLGGVKPRQILELLAVEAGTPVAKDRLAERLWQGRPPRSYRATLESYVCVLRRSLGLAGGRRGALATTTHGYVLDPLHVRVDVVQVRRLLHQAVRATPVDAVDLTDQALARVTGPLLASDPYVDWALEERGRLDRLLVQACTAAAGHALALDRTDEATRLARAALEREPLAELAARHLMAALWRSGQRSQALHVYAELRAAMVEEVGTQPGPEVRTLYLEVLGDEVACGGGNAAELPLLLALLRHALHSVPRVGLDASDDILAAVRALTAA